MPDRRDRGFTLIEVIVVIALLALISSVMTAVVAVVVRTEGPTDDRTITASSLRGLETWLSQDVIAVAPSGFELEPLVSTGCTGTSPGISLLHLTWTEQAGGNVTYLANYRFEDDGVHKLIRRYTCSSTGAVPYSNRESVRVTRALAATTPTVVAIKREGDTVGVTITAHAATGTTFTVTSTTRNPSATLPTTTTVAPLPCTVITTNLPLTAANLGDPGPEVLENDVTLTFTMGGACGSLTLQYDRGEGVQTVAFTGTHPNFTVELEADDENWSDGPHTMTVMNDSTALAPTYEFTVS